MNRPRTSAHANDAHIFCTPEQAVGEALAALRMISEPYQALRIKPARYRLSLPGPGGKYAGDPELRQRSADILIEALARAGLPYEAGPGEAALYGPKINVQVLDSADREGTLSTVQIDFYGPGRFGLHYTGADGGKHRPVMVHRSIVGSVERCWLRPRCPRWPSRARHGHSPGGGCPVEAFEDVREVGVCERTWPRPARRWPPRPPV